MAQNVSKTGVSYKIGRGMRSLIVVAVLALFFISALTSYAQNETTTTSYQTITIANISITYPRNIVITAKYVNRTMVEVIITSGTVIETPLNVTLVVGYNGTIYYNKTIIINGSPFGRKVVYVNVNSEKVWIYSMCCGFNENQTITYYSYSYPRAVSYVINLIPWLIMSGLVMRGDPKLSGLGAIIASVIIYVMSATGLIPASPAILIMSIVIGAVLLWMG